MIESSSDKSPRNDLEESFNKIEMTSLQFDDSNREATEEKNSLLNTSIKMP